MKPVAAYLRSLNPDLPRSVWTLQGGALVNALGNGITMPFLFIYLHNVRGFTTATSGLVLAFLGIVGLAVGPIFGAFVDRLGGRSMLGTSLVLMAIGYGLFPLVREPWHAFAIAAVAGLGNGGFWPAQGSLLAGLTSGARRSSAYAMQRVAANFGIGAGGVVGGLIANASEPRTFTILFVLDAITFFAYLFVLPFVPEPQIERHEQARGRYATVVRDKAFMAFIALNLVFITTAIAMLVQILPAFMKNEASVTEKAIGLVFFANTTFIVLFQLPVAKWIEGRRRMVALAAMGVIYAASWLVVAATGRWLEATAAALVFAFAVVVFALGECLHGPVWGPMVADLAPPQLRGRYLAFSSASWGIGFVIGPALGGFLLGRAPFALWLAMAGVLVVASGGAIAMERLLEPRLRRVPRRERRRDEPRPLTLPAEATAGP